MTADDEDVAEIMAQEIATKGPVETVWTAVSAFQMVALVQLALRHPGVRADLRKTAAKFLEHMRVYFADCPMVSDVIKRGDNPAEDR